MSNEVRALSVYDRMPDPLKAIEVLGDDIAKSQMFGCDNIHQGRVMAMTCMAKGLPPMEIAEKYHVIHGKLSMKSETMLAEFLDRGGKHKIIKRTANEVAIELTSSSGDKQNFKLTWKDAQGEAFPYKGKEDVVLAKIAAKKTSELELKPKYQTPHSRTQMLWARLISDAVRAMDPRITSGGYTPEEIGDFAPAADGVQAGNEATQVLDAEVVEAEVQAESTGVNESRPEPALDIDSETAKVHEQIADLLDEIECPPGERAAMLKRRDVESIEQLSKEDARELLSNLEGFKQRRDTAADDELHGICKQIIALFDDLGCPPEARAEILAKRNVEAVERLSKDDAEQLLAGLKARKAEAVSESTDGPLTDAQVMRIRAKVGEICQDPHLEMPDLAFRIKAKLEQAGVEGGLSGLSRLEARALETALDQKEMAAFFDASLKGWSGN